MRRRTGILAALLGALALWLLAPGQARAEPGRAESARSPAAPADLAARQSQELDLTQLEGLVKDASRTWQGYGPEISLRDFLEIYRGEEQGKFSPGAILGGFFRYLVREVLGNADLLVQLLVLAVAAALLQNLQSAFDSDGTGKLAYAVVYLTLAGVAVAGFGLAFMAARQVTESLTGFMLAVLPTLLTVLAGMGGLTSAALFHPIMITLVTTAAATVANIVFPLIFLAAVLEIVSGLNENYKLTNLAGLLKQGATLVMGFTFTIFMGLVGIKGAAGAVADGLAMKTAKFALGSFVPVVGKMFADATDLIFGSTLLLKNALGMLGAAAIFFITAFPLLKILSLSLIYQLAGALVQPVGAGPIAAILGTISRSLQSLFGAVAVVALMFFLSITVIVGAANVAAMAR